MLSRTRSLGLDIRFRLLQKPSLTAECRIGRSGAFVISRKFGLVMVSVGLLKLGRCKALKNPARNSGNLRVGGKPS